MQANELAHAYADGQGNAATDSLSNRAGRWQARDRSRTHAPAPGHHRRGKRRVVEFIRRYGLEVRHGPFAGMRYLEGVERTSGDLIAKVAGTYEAELHTALAGWLQTDISLVVNVGCADGYYAVGLARALPEVEVLAYDIDPPARIRCNEMAQINDVAERVSVEGECLPETLAALPRSRVALVCDCEGCEKTLLDPALAPTLSGWRLIVELHDFLDATITDTITARFSQTHEIEIIPSLPAQSTDLPEFAFMTPRQRRAVLTERPVPMSWAHMRPRQMSSP